MDGRQDEPCIRYTDWMSAAEENTLAAWLFLLFIWEPLSKKAGRNMNLFMLSRLVSNAVFLLCVLVWGCRRWQLRMWQMPIPGTLSCSSTACALGWLWNVHYLSLNSHSVRTTAHPCYPNTTTKLESTVATHFLFPPQWIVLNHRR